MAEVIAEFERASARAGLSRRGFRWTRRASTRAWGFVNVRWIHPAMTAESARYAGHGDMLREQIAAGGGVSGDSPARLS
ncbi:DUF664 domain-containing protein [Nocardia testacea]|uniref:mycothiol transferase n=1 Tax=Nocardia testacea TaxID=248551 RepID=UPI003C30CE8F